MKHPDACPLCMKDPDKEENNEWAPPVRAGSPRGTVKFFVCGKCDHAFQQRAIDDLSKDFKIDLWKFLFENEPDAPAAVQALMDGNGAPMLKLAVDWGYGEYLTDGIADLLASYLVKL